MSATVFLTLGAALSLALAPAAAPPEAVAKPRYVDVYPAAKERAVAVYLHGGGWLSATDLDNTADAIATRTAKKLNPHGITLASVDYRTGSKSIRDTLRAFAWVDSRERWRRTRVCSLGLSAGGHLAFLTSMRKAPDCVVSMAGPVNLFSLAGNLVERLQGWFPNGKMRALSPLQNANEISARSLIYAASCDPKVSYEDQKLLALRSRRVVFRDVEADPNGPRALHCNVERRARDRMWNGLTRFIRSGVLPRRH